MSAQVSALSLTNVGKILEINSYLDYGDGDVLIKFDTGLNACPDGVFIPGSIQSKPASQMAGSMALAAHLAQRDVRMEVFTSNLWSGSESKKYCAIRRIDIK